MHEMGFKIVDRFNEMTRKQKIFFQLAYINKQEKLKREYDKEYDNKIKTKDIAKRWR